MFKAKLGYFFFFGFEYKVFDKIILKLFFRTENVVFQRKINYFNDNILLL